MNRFGIVGYGIVGESTHKGLLLDRKIKIYDISTHNNIENLKGCTDIFFCIPTNDREDIDRLFLEVQQVSELCPDSTIIIRSTVPIGTCSHLETQTNKQVIYIPEFVRERCWEQDCLKRPLIVGSNNILPGWLEKENIIKCSLEDAEILKMFSNNYAVLRIVFANHFYEISKKIGVDYKFILDAYEKIKNDQSYLEANDNLRGFGGKCLPKDLDFIIDSFKNFNLNQTLFDSLKKDNELWKTTVRKY